MTPPPPSTDHGLVAPRWHTALLVGLYLSVALAGTLLQGHVAPASALKPPQVQLLLENHQPRADRMQPPGGNEDRLATARLDDVVGQRVDVVEAELVHHLHEPARADLVAAAKEAGEADFDVLIACAFNYEAHTTEFSKLGRIRLIHSRRTSVAVHCLTSRS